MSDYRSVRKDLAERMGDATADPGEALLPCGYCGEPTKRRVLGMLGARCQACYDQYLRLGYSGQEPPKQALQAAWVQAEADKARRVRAARASRGSSGNVFAAMSQQLNSAAAARALPKGLSDEEVNELLEGVR